MRAQSLTHKKAVLVAGDSISMSRRSEGIPFECTYSAALQAALPSTLVHNSSIRANDSSILASVDYIRENIFEIQPAHIVVQIGIVDCTPRIFSNRQKKLLSMMKRLVGLRRIADMIIMWSSRHRYEITRIFPRPFTPLCNFSRNIGFFVSEARRLSKGCSFSIINIPRPTGNFILRNWGVINLVEMYNNALSDIAVGAGGNMIDLYDHTLRHPELMLPDGYHISLPVHEYLFRELMRINHYA